MKNKFNSKIRKSIVIGLLITMMFPSNAFAHNAVYLKTTIDDSSISYQSNTFVDKIWGNEDGHQVYRIDSNGFINTINSTKNPIRGVELSEENLSKFQDIKNGGTTSPTTGQTQPTTGTSNGLAADSGTNVAAGSNPQPFLFPPVNDSGFNSDPSSAETNRAAEIGGRLTNNLNEILMTVNDGGYSNVEDLIKTSMLIRPATKEGSLGYFSKEIKSLRNPDNTYQVFYSTPVIDTSNPSKKTSDTLSGEISKSDFASKIAQADDNGNLYAYVFKVSGGKVDTGSIKKVVWAMPKGYSPIKGVNGDKPLIMNNVQDISKKDTAYISMHMLSEHANMAYYVLGSTTNNSNDKEGTNFISQFIYDTIANILYGLESILGLYTLDELVFNKGFRGTEGYVNGLMDQKWWTEVVKYHLIFQVIAWVLIAAAIIKTLIQLNFSVINPNLRLDIMESIQKMFLVGFLLISILPLILFMGELNNTFTGIFATQTTFDLSQVGKHGSITNVLAGVLVQFVYFFIEIYVNFVYIMRSIMIAILTATGPLFVVSMAFSLKGKGLFDNFLREIMANIWLQGYHAMALSFIFAIQSSSRGITELVLAFSVVPLTEFFRNFIFGQNGSFAIAQGKMLANTAKAAGVGLTQGAWGALGASSSKMLGANLDENGEFGGNGPSRQGSRQGGGGLQGQGFNFSDNLNRAAKFREDSANVSNEGGVDAMNGMLPSGGLGSVSPGGQAMGKGLAMAGSAARAVETGGRLLGNLMDIGSAPLSGDMSRVMGQSMAELPGNIGSFAGAMGGSYMAGQAASMGSRIASSGSGFLGTRNHQDGSKTNVYDSAGMSLKLAQDQQGNMVMSGNLSSLGNYNKETNTFTPHKGLEGESAGLASMIAMSNTEGGRKYLDSQGVSSIKMSGDGGFEVKGNKQYMSNVGIQSVRNENGKTYVRKSAGTTDGTSLFTQFNNDSVINKLNDANKSNISASNPPIPSASSNPTDLYAGMMNKGREGSIVYTSPQQNKGLRDATYPTFEETKSKEEDVQETREFINEVKRDNNLNN